MSNGMISNTQLTDLLSRLFPALGESLDPRTTLHAQGINSMGMIVLITHLQDEFGLVFESAALVNLHTLTLESLQRLCVDRC